MQPDPKEVWGDGAAYERYVGRWSRRVARDFLNWLAVPAASRWLDIGCGTGALSQSILETAAPSRVDSLDYTFRYVAFTKEQLQAEPLNVVTADARALPMTAGTYHAVVSGLVLNFIPELQRAVGEMARVARIGSVVATYVWDYAGQMEFLRHFWDAAIALDGEARDLDEGRRFPICHPQPLTDLFQSAGLHDVQVQAIDVATPFRDLNDSWVPFFGGQGPAPKYLLSLNVERQVALRELLRKRLPFAPDGSLTLMARAWAARGKR